MARVRYGLIKIVEIQFACFAAASGAHGCHLSVPRRSPKKISAAPLSSLENA